LIISYIYRDFKIRKAFPLVKFTVYTLAFPNYSAEEAIKAAAQLGYDGVDIRVREDGHVFIDAPKEFRKRLVELAESLGIRIYGVYTYLGRNFVVPDPNVRRRALEEARAHLDLAVDLNGAYVRIFAGTKERTERNMKLFIEMCRLVCREAEDRGLLIGIETHGELVYSGDTCNLVLEEVGCDALTIVYDIAHIYMEGLNPLEELKKVDLNKVIAFQFHDFKKEDSKWRAVLLSYGEVPHDPVIEYLRSQGYDKFVVDEYEKWWRPELPDPMVGLKHNLKYLKEKFGVVR